MNESARHPTLREGAKTVGSWILGLGGLALLAAVSLAFIYGAVWVSAKLYPIVEALAVLGLVVFALNLLPSAIFRGSRRYCGQGIVIVSYIWGASLWMYSILILHQLWGAGGVYLGFFTFGVATVPLACVALLFRGQWGLIGQLVLGAVIVIATRLFGYWIASKGETPHPALSEWE